MNENKPISSYATSTVITSQSKVLGIDDNGKAVLFTLAQLRSNNIGQFKTNDAAPPTPLLNQNYELIGTAVGNTPSGTYTNLLGSAGTAIVIPAAAAGSAILNARAVWNGNYWVPVWQQVTLPPADGTLPPRVTTLENNIVQTGDLNYSNVYKSKVVPYDKSAVSWTAGQYMDYANWWGDGLSKIQNGIATLTNVKVTLGAAGTFLIGFATITNNVATIVYSKSITETASGTYTYTSAQLAVPDLSSYGEVYIVIRNNASTGRCVFYKAATNTKSFYFPVTTGAVSQIPAYEISYWCTIATNDSFQLPIKVLGTSTYSQLVEALDNNGYVYLNEGTFTLTQTLKPKPGQKIIGKGRKTIIQAAAGLAIPIYIQDSQDVVLSDFVVKGNDAAPDINASTVLPSYTDAETNVGMGLNYGIFVQGNGAIINNIWVENFNADAILVRLVGYAAGNIFTNGIKMHNIFIKDCYRGVHLDTTAEYSQYSNITVRNCLIGATVRGGNNNISNCQFTANRLGFHMSGLNSNNDAHGLITNVSANHSIVKGGYFKDIKNGQSLNGFTVFYSGVEINNCKGINWNGGQIGSGSVDIINAAGKNQITNVAFAQFASKINTGSSGIIPYLKNNFYILSTDSDALLNN